MARRSSRLLIAFGDGPPSRRWHRAWRPGGGRLWDRAALLQGLGLPGRSGLDRHAHVALHVRDGSQLGLARVPASGPRRPPRPGPPDRRSPAPDRSLLHRQRQRLLRGHREDRHLARGPADERLSGPGGGSFASPRLQVPGPARLGLACHSSPRYSPDGRRRQRQHGPGRNRAGASLAGGLCRVHRADGVDGRRAARADRRHEISRERRRGSTRGCRRGDDDRDLDGHHRRRARHRDSRSAFRRSHRPRGPAWRASASSRPRSPSRPSTLRPRESAPPRHR